GPRLNVTCCPGATNRVFRGLMLTSVDASSERTPPAARDTPGSAPSEPFVGQTFGTCRQSTKSCTTTFFARFFLPVAGTATVTGTENVSVVGGRVTVGGTVTWTGTPVHTWFWHVEEGVVGSPSSHASPSGVGVLAGHARLVPSHVAFCSQG